MLHEITAGGVVVTRRERHPRGYWLRGGDGYEAMVELLKKCTIAQAARELGCCYSYATKVAAVINGGRYLGAPQPIRRKHTPEYLLAHKLRAVQNKNFHFLLRAYDTQEIDASDCSLAKTYHWKGRAYASMEAHVSRSGGMK